jgi:hypothetical protein
MNMDKCREERSVVEVEDEVMEERAAAVEDLGDVTRCNCRYTRKP